MNEKEIKALAEQSVQEFNQEFINKWVLFSLYLEQELAEGKRELPNVEMIKLSA